MSNIFTKTRFKSGQYDAVCDVCGRVFKRSELTLRWDGYLVCSSDFEERQPQDYVRARQDKVQPNKSRGVPANSYVSPHCSTHTSVPAYAIPGCAIPGTATIPISSSLPAGTF